MTLAIVVPCYQRLAFTQACLQNLVNMLSKERLLVLVDDGSGDGTAKYLEMFRYKNKVVVLHEENKGLPVAYNAGVRTAKENGCDVVCIVDNDLLVPFQFDEVLLDDLGTIENSIVGGLVASDKNIRMWLQKQGDAYKKPEPVSTMIIGGGAVVAMPIAAWERAKGFCEVSKQYDYVDAKFFNDVRWAGYKTYIDPRVICVEMQSFAYTDIEYERSKLKNRLAARCSLPQTDFNLALARIMRGRNRIVVEEGGGS